jgi:DNA-binding GntR family transcriptional regulator
MGRPGRYRDIADEIEDRAEIGRYEAGQPITTQHVREEFDCSQGTAISVLLALEARKVLYREPGAKRYLVAARRRRLSQDIDLSCPHCRHPIVVTLKPRSAGPGA